jgi:hypothetical protein
VSEFTGQPALPAAWYPDPKNAAVLRWWDGAAWTEHVKELPPPPESAAPVVPPVVPAAQSAVVRPTVATGSALTTSSVPLTPQQVAHARALGEFHAPKTPVPEVEGFVIKTRVPEINARYSDDGARYVPLSTRNDLPASLRDDNDDFDKDDDVGSRQTVEMWLLGALPAFAFAGQFSLLHYTSIFNKNPHLFWVVPALLVLLGFVFSTLDRGTLLSRNVKNPPHGALGIIPPFYLVLRAVRVTPVSLLPLILWIALAAGLLFPWMVLYGSIPSTFPGYLQLLQIANGS